MDHLSHDEGSNSKTPSLNKSPLLQEPVPPYSTINQLNDLQQPQQQPVQFMTHPTYYSMSPSYYQVGLPPRIPQQVFNNQRQMGGSGDTTNFYPQPPNSLLSQDSIMTPLTGTNARNTNNNKGHDQVQYQHVRQFSLHQTCPPEQTSIQRPPQTTNCKKKSGRTGGSSAINSSRTAAAYPRRRALTACDTCRIKKIKCDNVRPRCGSCIKNGDLNCHYRSDDQIKDYSSYDPASLNILTKLDCILNDLKVIKEHNEIDENNIMPKSNKKHKEDTDKYLNKFRFDKCSWDMSLTSIIKWDYFKKIVQETPDSTNQVIKTLISDYNRVNLDNISKKTLDQRNSRAKGLEALLSSLFPSFINSFLINCHTKIPVLDTLQLFESIEIYNILKSNDSNITFVELLETFNLKDEKLPELYYTALRNQNIEVTEIRSRAYEALCKSIPSLLLICALGIISAPVQLDNLGKFNTSLEERSTVELGCLSGVSLPDGLPKDRLHISQLFIDYAGFLASVFPYTLEESSLGSVKYYLLLSQYYLYVLSPLKSYRLIVCACQNMMYYLAMRRLSPDSSEVLFVQSNEKEIVDRLFWTCLKLECELRVELSPYVPLSGITQILPPTSFPKIPASITGECNNQKMNHSEAAIILSKKYDDRYSWYYFLTEIAVRKVDNKMFDEIFSFESSINTLWDQPHFINESVWIIFIKYLNQYNGIINSLNPRIRSFLLQEVNVEQIYMSMKKKQDKKRQNIKTENDVFDRLDEFLIDEDLILKAQSESIMFIKTRIVTSKLVLFRPLIYLVLEDKISFKELLEAAFSVMKKTISDPSATNTMVGSDSPISSLESVSISNSTESNSSNFMDMDYFNIGNAPMEYQKQNPEEDFSDLVDPDLQSKNVNSDEYNFKLNDLSLARRRILRVFIQNLMSLPKLNIPKLGFHRHPGSWYYLRNLFIGCIYQFSLFKKLQEMSIAAANDEQFKSFVFSQSEITSTFDINKLSNLVLPRETVHAILEHSLSLFEYWKDESKDCEVYHSYVTKFLDNL